MKNKKIGLAFAAVMVAMGVYASGGHGNNPPYPNFGLPRVEEMMFLVLQIGVILITKTNSCIHDLLANTVAVDLSSQMIFDSVDAMNEYKKKIHAEQVKNADY